MKQLLYTAGGDLAWADCPEPELRDAAAALVRPVAVASCDLDLAVIRGIAPLPGPYAFGHEFVAEVMAIGPDVTGPRPGDVVSVPFQISCGDCSNCRDGRTGNCTSVPAGASYGLGAIGGVQWGGALADLVVVPYADAMCVRLPATVTALQAASLSDNLPDAYRAVTHAGSPGDPVLIFGGASIGLYAAQIAVALDRDVTYCDDDPQRLAAAERLGVRVIDSRTSRPRRSPHVIHTSGDHDKLARAVSSTGLGGIVVDTGIYFDPTTPVPLLEMYGRGVTLYTGRAHARRDMPSVLSLIEQGRIDPAAIPTRVVAWDDAPAAFDDPVTKVVIIR